MRYLIHTLLLALCASSGGLLAEVSLPNVFGDHMVLQRDQKDPVWGWADPGEAITVTIAGQSHKTTADADGKWRVELDPMEAGGPYELVVQGTNTVTFRDVLVGEVWVCSGQSNMQWNVGKSNNAEVEIASAKNNQIRLLTVPTKGTQELQDNFNGKWAVCSPETVKDFSAVGYFFGRRLQQTLGVPIGLIDNAWGGSSAEAWIPREDFSKTELTAEFLANADAKLQDYTDESYQEALTSYEEKRSEWEAQGKKGRAPRRPSDPRYNQHRPANIYNGMVYPIQGYGIQGVIWYQGESNAGRAKSYQTVFPMVITSMREKWGQGDFPFYWVQLADYNAETDDANAKTAWAELREAQTMTLNLPNTGEAVIIDVGEGRDIHPRNKQVPAERLARWALANDYDIDMHYQSPTFQSMEVQGNKAILTFDHVSGEGLYSFDTNEVKGFSIAGDDKNFYWADAKVIGKNQVEVSSDQVSNPVAVRYGWAQNPVVNLQDRNGLPVTPFRSDTWPGVTN